MLSWFLTLTFVKTFVGATGTYGIPGILVGLVLFGYMNYQAALRSFSLITHVPDKVGRWFGAQGESMGEGSHADRLVGVAIGGIEQKSQAVSGVMRGKSASSVPVGDPGGGGGKGGGPARTAPTTHQAKAPVQD